MDLRHGASALSLFATGLMLSACGSLIPSGSLTNTGAGASTGNVTPDERKASDVSQSRNGSPGLPACLSELAASGASFDVLFGSDEADDCTTQGAVRFTRMRGDRSMIEASNLGPVQCETAKAFVNWARYGVDRAASQILGSPIVRIETMGSYACRNVSGTQIRSAHARAAAIDVSGFVLADGRRIVIQRDWQGGNPATREFLRVVHKSACKRFGTVLGPAFNANHADHFHLESTGSKVCR
jgi:hypothetical protein